MPLTDTTGRLSTDRCAIQLRDSDNRQLYDFSVIDRHVFANTGALKATCAASHNVCDSGARAAIDAYLRGGGNDCNSVADDDDDDTAYLLVPQSMLKVPDSAECGPCDDPHINKNDESSCKPRQQWDGYGLGACAQNIGALQNEKGRTQPRTFVATPNYGVQANSHRVPLQTPDVRRGSRLIMMSSDDTRYGPQPLSFATSSKTKHAIGKKTFCDTYLRVRAVDDIALDKDKAYGCCSEPSGRIVDRLAEREWDVFDPVISKRDNGDVNILRPCEWIPGGAASRDIARTPEFRRLLNTKLS
jgi:hypothetical protein